MKVLVFIGNPPPYLGFNHLQVKCIQAARVDHHVPIFWFQCSFQYGLPSLPTSGGDHALPVDEVDELEKNRLAIEELDEIDRKLAVFEEREKRVGIPEPSDPEAAVPAHSADDSGGVGGGKGPRAH